jgi:hypothetical protein
VQRKTLKPKAKDSLTNGHIQGIPPILCIVALVNENVRNETAWTAQYYLFSKI